MSTALAAEVHALRQRLDARTDGLATAGAGEALEVALALRDAITTCTAAEHTALTRGAQRLPPAPTRGQVEPR